MDISSEGTGLDRIFGLRVGQRVCIEFEDDRKLDGIVTWTAGGRAGIEYASDAPLAARASDFARWEM